LRWLPHAGNLTLGLTVAFCLCLGVLAWRLAQGPLEVPPLARHIEAAANAALPGSRLEIGRAAIAWEGFRGGTAAPLDIVLQDVRMSDAAGATQVELPDAAVTLSVRALLRGMVAPSTIELRRPRVLVLLRPNGSLGLTLQPEAEATEPEPTEAGADAFGLLAELMRPASEGAAHTALRRIRVNGGEIILSEVATGRRWTLAEPQIELRRAANGGLAGEGSATFRSGAINVPVRLVGAASGTPMTLAARIGLPALRPSELADIWPPLAPLAVLDTPMALTAGGTFNATGQPERLEIGLDGGAGTLDIGAARLPVDRLAVRLEGNGEVLRLTEARLVLGGRTGPAVTATGEARLQDGAWTTSLDLGAGPVQAGELPTLWPATLAPELREVALRALPAGRLRDARLRLEVRAPETLDGVALRQARVSFGLDQAVLDLGANGRIAAESLELAATLTPESLRLDRALLRLPGGALPPAVDGPVLAASGSAERRDGIWRGSLGLELDSVRFADLASYWPEPVAPGARDWITQNVTAGSLRNGRWRVEAEAPEALDTLRITGFSGTAEASDATVYWLRPVPPLRGVSGTAEFSLSEVILRSRSGRQMLSDTARSGIEVREANVRFYDLEASTNNAEMTVQLAGPLADAVTILRHPRLKLFERRKLELNVGAGQIDARLVVGFPLLSDLPIEDLRISAEARVAAARLTNVLLDQTLDNANIDLSVNTNTLKANGQAVLLGAPVRIGVEMDFRNGPGTQVIERATLTGRLDQRQLNTLGFDTLGVLDGPVAVDARSEKRRNGQGSVALRGDLRDARLMLDVLGWQKPVGAPSQGEATLRMQGDALVAADGIRLVAPELAMRGSAAFGTRSRLERVSLSEASVGASRFGGEVRRPERQGGPWQAMLRGPVFDLRPALRGPERTQPAAAAAEEHGPPLALDLGFERVTMGEGRYMYGVHATALMDGRGLLREGRANGRTAAAAGPASGFGVALTPNGTQRHLQLTAEDGGALLHALDLVDSIRGGRLRVDARYRELRPGAPLTGTAELDQFVLRDAPAAAKLMQAMTLYGLVEALQGGSGLVFSRLVAPFTLTAEALELSDARAFSASLGLTAKGRIRREGGIAAIEGTIVPAYMFNTLLGNIPLLGRLFSPEAGGGVFAGTYRVQGPLSDPQVTVNPLAALTPGFLRGMFGLGQPAAPAR
jgi:hypothetical protein